MLESARLALCTRLKNAPGSAHVLRQVSRKRSRLLHVPHHAPGMVRLLHTGPAVRFVMQSAGKRRWRSRVRISCRNFGKFSRKKLKKLQIAFAYSDFAECSGRIYPFLSYPANEFEARGISFFWKI